MNWTQLNLKFMTKEEVRAARLQKVMYLRLVKKDMTWGPVVGMIIPAVFLAGKAFEYVKTFL